MESFGLKNAPFKDKSNAINSYYFNPILSFNVILFVSGGSKTGKSGGVRAESGWSICTQNGWRLMRNNKFSDIRAIVSPSPSEIFTDFYLNGTETN